MSWHYPHSGLSVAFSLTPALSRWEREIARGLLANPRAELVELASGHYHSALNMTDAMGGLTALMQAGGAEYEAALARPNAPGPAPSPSGRGLG